MSTLSVDTITKADGSGSLTVPAESGTVVTTASPSLGRRNLIINGAMQVAQRGTSFTTDGFTVDRFYYQDLRNDEITKSITQDSDAPAGFANSLKIVATNPETSWTTDEFVRFFYKIEAQDVQHLNYGTADAVTTTLSFWVKSDVTGTYCVSFYNPDSGRRLTNTYTVNAADTWEYKTVTVVGDTSGSINNDNGEGIQISFCLATGPSYTSTDSTSWVANSDGATFYGHDVAWGTTTNDYWQITGVQLEVGTVATPFEHISYGEQLALCERYYQGYNFESYSGWPGAGRANGNPYAIFSFPLRTTMRTAPSGTWLGTNNGMIVVRVSDGTTEEPTSIAIVGYSENAVSIRPETTDFSTGTALVALSSGGGNQMAFEVEAEL